MRLLLGLCALLSAAAGLASPQPLSARHPAVPIIPGVVRLLIYIKKRDDITFQEFSDHWRVIHPPIFMDTQAVKKNVTKYEQVRHLHPLTLRKATRLIVLDNPLVPRQPGVETETHC